MYEFLALESCDVHLCERLRVLRSIYAQPPLLYLLKSQVFLQIKSLKSTYDVANKSIYDGQFHGNILVVRKTACGKTYFRQKLGLNKSFGKLIKTKWAAGIKTDEQREAEIQSCFSNRVEFHLSTESDNLVSLIENLNLKLEI